MKAQIANGKIMVDGVAEDFANFLYTLKGEGDNIYLTKSLIVDLRRMPSFRRLAGMPEGSQVRNAITAACPNIDIPLVINRQPAIPAEYREEVRKQLRKGIGADKLYDFLFANDRNSKTKSDNAVFS